MSLPQETMKNTQYLKKIVHVKNVYIKKRDQFKFVVRSMHVMKNLQRGLNISSFQKILFSIPTQPFAKSCLSFIHTKKTVTTLVMQYLFVLKKIWLANIRKQNIQMAGFFLVTLKPNTAFSHLPLSISYSKLSESKILKKVLNSQEFLKINDMIHMKLTEQCTW